MLDKTKHIFIFILIFSVFSLTLQASIIHICKESKVFKNQNQQNPITEEEEEEGKTHDGDESPDEDVLYLTHHHFSFSSLETGRFTPNNSVFNFLSCYFKIPIPPPKYQFNCKARIIVRSCFSRLI